MATAVDHRGVLTHVATQRLQDVPGGALVAKKIERVHPARLTARTVLAWIEAVAADETHVMDLVRSVCDSKSPANPSVRAKLAHTMDLGCIMDMITVQVPSQASWRKGCFA